MSFGLNDRYWTESIYDPTDERALPAQYTRYMTAALAYASEVTSIAEIGFGGGRTVWYLHTHMPDVSVTSVELDPDVVALARKYFDVREENNFSIVVKDGRLFLARDTNSYDVILVDAYRGPFVPFHLLTQEFYETAKKRLADGGVLAQNIEPSTMLFEAAIITLRSVFQNVDLYEAGGNIVAIAYDGPTKTHAALMNSAKELQDRYQFLYPIADLLDKRQTLTRLPPGRPLNDDFAPVETLRAIERHNQGIDEYVEQPPR